MRRQLVAQVLRLAHTWGRLAQMADLAQQAVDLLLLAQDLSQKRVVIGHWGR